MSNSDSNQLSFSKIAFNFYGGLNSGSTPEAKASSKFRENTRERFANEIIKRPKILHNCGKDVSCITELNYSLKNLISNCDDDPRGHIVLGGKNYLRLLALNSEQTLILEEVDILEQISKNYRKILQGGRISHVSSLKACHDIIACELSTGQFAVCKIQNNGKANLMHMYADHKRPINSIDFVPVLPGISETSPSQVISGSQDGTIKLWDMRSSSVKPALTIKSGSHMEPVRACEISSHSTVRNKLNILSVHDSGALYKHDVRSPLGTGSLSVAAERKWNFHTGPALSLHIHPEAEFVMTGGRDKKICVFDYSETASLTNKLNPDIILNSFGPVLKVQWCPYDSNENANMDQGLEGDFSNGEDKSVFEKDINSSLPHPSKLGSLYSYNIACLFLHEDPTIAIYDLKRKFVPKYVLQSQTNKPFQNFIWAENTDHLKTLWTVTKDNYFASYTLDTCEGDDYIYLPLDNLPKVAMAWNYGLDTLCFVAQDKEEFESGSQQDYQPNLTEYQLSTGENESFLGEEKVSHTNGFVESSGENGARRFLIPGGEQHSVYDYQSGLGSVPVATNSNLSTSSSFLSSHARPNMFRSMTAGSFASFTKRFPSKRLEGDTDSDTTFQGQSLKFPGRHFSESAQKSPFSINSVASNAKEKKNALVSHASPYVFTLDMGFARTNEHTFELLASNYLIFVPEGFNLANVCLYNANIAAMANRFRESQTWKIIAINIEDFDTSSAGKEAHSTQFPAVLDNENEGKSSTSETDNLVGSYNTVSTLTTNYGRLPSFGQRDSFDSGVVNKEKEGLRMSQLPESWNEGGNSHSAVEEAETTERSQVPTASIPQAVTSHDHGNLKKDEGDLSNTSPLSKTEKSTVPSGEVINKGNLPLQEAQNRQNENFFHGPDREKIASNSENARYSPFSAFGSPASPTSLRQTPTSLENRNMWSSNHVMTNRIQQGRYNMINQDLKPQTSRVDPVRGFLAQPKETWKDSATAKEIGKDEPSINEKSRRGKKTSSPSNEKTTKSALSNVFGKTASKEDNPLSKPWALKNLLREALNYSVVEGEIIFCATLTILFYDYTKFHDYCIFTREQSLDWILLYIELLQKRKLFSNAISVINNVPEDLKDEIVGITIKDVDLQFKCCWCSSALSNESSMRRAKKVGYTENWFCDNCKRRQMNCIYCNEPCLGLNVAISLHCGHRGHFGCLKEWFVEEENIECPGGCDYSIF